MKKIIISITLIAVAFAACKTAEKSTTAKPKIDCTGKTYTFVTDIKPIMDQFCVRCHNTNLKAGYNFTNLSYVKKAASEGSLLGTIRNEKGYKHMPATGEQLDQAIIDKIECWINNGMK